MSEKRHIVGGADGWLNVKREPTGEIVALPEYLHVEVSQCKDGRDYFKALEGSGQGRAFSVKQGHLKSGTPAYKHAARIEFHLAAETLSYLGKSVKAITASGSSAIPNLILCRSGDGKTVGSIIVLR